MSLQLRASKRNINNWVLTVASVFAFVIAPFYGVVADSVANAVDGATTSTSPAPTIQPCTTTNTIQTTSLSTWNLNETRANGHNVITADGLHVWTDSNTSTDKAAGYYPASFALADLGEGFGVTTTSGNGTLPSLQLLVDLDNDGRTDGYLVGEPTYYGANSLWLSSNWHDIDLGAAPTSFNGGGTGKGGSANAWLAAFPDAKVSAIGYSLGSGVHGDYVISNISAGCTNYTFALDNVMPDFNIITPANGTTVRGTQKITAEVSDPSGITKVLMSIKKKDGKNLSYSWSATGNGSLTKAGDTYSVNVDTTLLADGANYVTLRGTDGAGNTRYWNNNASDRQHVFYVDNSAPKVTGVSVSPIRTNGHIVHGKVEVTVKIDEATGLKATGNWVRFMRSYAADSSTNFSSGNYKLVATGTTGEYKAVVDTNDFAAGKTLDHVRVYIRTEDTLGTATSVYYKTPNGTTNTQYDANGQLYYLTIDNQAPSVTINKPASSDLVSTAANGNTLKITGNFLDAVSVDGAKGSGASRISFQLLNSHNGAVAQGIVYGYQQNPSNHTATFAAQNGDFTYNMSVPANLPSGEYKLKYNGADYDGNSTGDRYITFTVDNDAPTAHIVVSPLHNSQYITKVVTVTGSVDASEQNIKSHWFEITGPNGYLHYAYDMNSSANSWSFDWDTKGLANGAYVIRYVATDKAGNRSDDPNYTSPTKAVVVVDNQGPQASFTMTPSAYINGNFDLEGVASDNIKLKDVFFDIRVNNNGNAGALVSHTGCIATSLQKTFSLDGKSANISCTMSTAGLVDGTTYILRIHASDYAGYGGGQDVLFTFDTTKPTITAVNYVGDSTEGIFSKVSFSFYDAHNIVGFDLNGKYGALSPNNWSNYDFSNLVAYFGLHEGVNVITAYDAAGNTQSYTFTYDATPPKLTVDSYTGTNTTPTITGTTDGATDVVTVNGSQAAVSTTPNTDGTYDWEYTPIAPFKIGATILSIRSTDVAGNYTEGTATVTVSTGQDTNTPDDSNTNTGNGNDNNGDTTTGGGATVVITPGGNQTTGQNPVQSVLGASDNDADGATDSDTSSDKAVEGASDKKTDDKADKGCFKLFGLCWYWWIPIVIVAVLVIWWIISAAKRAKDDN